MKAADGLKRVLEVLDHWFGLMGRPAYGQDVKSCRPAQQVVPLKVMKGQIGETLLLALVHRPCRACRIPRFRRAHLDKDQAPLVDGNQV